MIALFLCLWLQGLVRQAFGEMVEVIDYQAQPLAQLLEARESSTFGAKGRKKCYQEGLIVIYK